MRSLPTIADPTSSGKEKGRASSVTLPTADGIPTVATKHTTPHAEASALPTAASTVRSAVLPSAPTVSNTWAQFPARPMQPPEGTLGLGPIVGTVPSQLGALELVLGVMARYFEGCTVADFGTRWYAEQAKIGIDGSVVAWAPRVGKAHPNEVHVEVTQSACDRLGLVAAIDLLRELRDLGMRASRIDGHLDDRHGVTTPAMVDAAVDANQLRTRVRRQSCKAIKVAGAVETVYVGSRQSGRMLRVYNGDKMHGIGTGTRWELEHHGKDAERFASLVAGSPPECMAATLIEAMRAHCDFVDRTNKGIHAERAPMLEWWAKLTAGVERLVMRWPSPIHYIERKIAWLEKQVAPTLALAFGYKGGAQRADFNKRGSWWLRHLLVDGVSRITTERYDLLEPRARTNLGMARWVATRA